MESSPCTAPFGFNVFTKHLSINTTFPYLRLSKVFHNRKDRVVPLPTSMWQELRRYWAFHRHSLLLFPNVGRGDHNPQALARRMQRATSPIPCSSLQRLVIIARKQLNLPAASVHSLRQNAECREMPSWISKTG
jgi:hypothetical protein